MYDLPKQPDARPPCGCCGEPAPNGFWHTHLCDACFRAWWAEAPPLDELERAHAAKHPEDVEARGKHPHRDAAAKHDDWLLMKPGVSERVAGVAARAWVDERRQRLTRRSA